MCAVEAQDKDQAPGVLSASRSVWLWTTFSSLLILGWFLFTVEAGVFWRALQHIETGILLISLVCLTVNGLLDALWLYLITRPRHPVAGPLRVIAWHMLGASILPARIGEVAFIYFIHRWLDVPGGRAVFITLYHRLQDLIVITGFLLITILGVGFETKNLQLVPVAFVMLSVLMIAVLRLEYSLTLGTLFVRHLSRRFGYRWLYTLQRHVLQIRMWYRHGLSRAQLWYSFLVIVLRWAVILPAIGIVLQASVTALDWHQSLFLTNVYIYMGIIPIQAIGGFGAGEVGLIWMLTLYGLSVGKASALSLLIRVLINAVHIGIWLLTVLALFFFLAAERTTKATHNIHPG